ncbi:MAG: rhomboid family intramembrane serine protease [Candidatus Nanoarchaeia archaeon]|nr:rhomboid family intramembrane serine protease [Candidatus Nanoarchaeia archaeon]MDD5741041.1 rhomboid family intramembrane serine protease [Candidatus Nanoarchaeia archaeon]
MEKWFDPKFENNYRRYTRKRLGGFSLENFLRKFSVTTWIIIINIIVFIFALLFMGIFGSDKILSFLALQPVAFFNGAIWTLLTSMFMHGNFTHLLVNMISLFFLGNFVEKLIGRKRFFWLYMISGIVAGLFFVFLAYFLGNTDFGARIFGSPDIYAVGASGAIFAIAGLLAVLTPKLRVYVFFVIPMQMWTAVVFLLVVLWAASIGAGLPFGNTAHFGGLLVGVVYALYLRNKYRRKTQLIARYFSG